MTQWNSHIGINQDWFSRTIGLTSGRFMLGNIPPLVPIFPRTWNSASKERFPRDFPRDSSPLLASGDRLDDKTTEHWIWILVYSYRVNRNWICLRRGGKNRHNKVLFRFNERIKIFSLFIESLLLLWILGWQTICGEITRGIKSLYRSSVRRGFQWSDLPYLCSRRLLWNIGWWLTH